MEEEEGLERFHCYYSGHFRLRLRLWLMRRPRMVPKRGSGRTQLRVRARMLGFSGFSGSHSVDVRKKVYRFGSNPVHLGMVPGGWLMG